MKRRSRSVAELPLLMTQMNLAAWEVIVRRSLMMWQNTCTPAEYRRMVEEKHAAALASASRFAATGGQASFASLMAPWHSRARANAKRLRKG